MTNQSYKSRYYDQIKQLFQPDGLDKYLKTSEYGAHYNTAYKMFQSNKIFGVGIKNYRVVTFKEKYRSDDYRHSRTYFPRFPTFPNILKCVLTLPNTNTLHSL